tara:strand:+ start:22425 stop:22832 length:408 start_codon:yes stop_codon:yes gene_type:complete
MRTREKLEKNCLHCQAAIPNRNIYCNNDCQWEYRKTERHKIIETLGVGALSSVKEEASQREVLKKYLTHKYGTACMECGWDKKNEYTQKVPTQLDHIDGNPHNQSLDNVRILCPNCHSLTEYFGARGKGRKQRYN